MNHRILFALVAACTPAIAARPAAAPAPATTGPGGAVPFPTIKVGPYQLQNRSSFALPVETRTPMWPIGWVRPKGELPKTTAFVPTGTGFQLQPHHLTVTSILLLGEPLATINGRAFGEGEVLPVYIGDRPIKVTVKAIRDGGVVVEQGGRQIFVPIQRKTIQEKTPEQQQAPSDAFKIKINEK